MCIRDRIGDDKTGMPSFNGLEIPKLTITFASNEEDANKRHYQKMCIRDRLLIL